MYVKELMDDLHDFALSICNLDFDIGYYDALNYRLSDDKEIVEVD